MKNTRNYPSVRKVLQFPGIGENSMLHVIPCWMSAESPCRKGSFIIEPSFAFIRGINIVTLQQTECFATACQATSHCSRWNAQFLTSIHLIYSHRSMHHLVMQHFRTNMSKGSNWIITIYNVERFMATDIVRSFSLVLHLQLMMQFAKKKAPVSRLTFIGIILSKPALTD